ncbi:MAG: hypothetical protein U0M23_08660 [Acutalibacteraceae bacterium]|nr:hypothetical protein [Acutalibacteraceae bacterium]HIR03502.1 hypothetical protein [Candidatus Scatovicinus merdipullorum]
MKRKEGSGFMKKTLCYFCILLLAAMSIFCGCASGAGSVKLDVGGSEYTAFSVEDAGDPTLYDEQVVTVDCTQDDLKSSRLSVNGPHSQNQVAITVFDENGKVLTENGNDFSLPNQAGIYYVCIGVDWGGGESTLHTDNLLKFKLTNS